MAAITLTPRERTILELTWQELSIKEQAVTLGVSVATVKAERRILMRLFGARTSVGMIKQAIAQGLVQNHHTTT